MARRLACRAPVGSRRRFNRDHPNARRRVAGFAARRSARRVAHTRTLRVRRLPPETSAHSFERASAARISLQNGLRIRRAQRRSVYLLYKQTDDVSAPPQHPIRLIRPSTRRSFCRFDRALKAALREMGLPSRPKQPGRSGLLATLRSGSVMPLILASEKYRAEIKARAESDTAEVVRLSGFGKMFGIGRSF